ncbi:hypothetical protein EDC18_10612 [Natranaerovirga pectinivora]|uniref:ATPase n=1 Tax=Natranaerovirga pectinivora TaxID=682400 RepID=A0A4R3MJI7_9FIRM|nr:ATP-binding protein [Natranaerovirga pectinivora]TCT14216.1 hypothetical protein EDC18_10612 [Natranaerovirga pectinivora]
MAEKVRRFFPGGNTSVGFYSNYDYIIDKNANRIIVLKGGPGTGKSSLMKKVAEVLLEQGYKLEFHHCSSDNESLDGIVVPELKVAMIDGTAPHVVDPKNPGAVDEIINLGEYWDVSKLEKIKQPILEYIEKNGKFYKRAYKYFGAARLILEDIIWKHEEALDIGKLNVDTDALIQEVFEDVKVSSTLGKERHLFGSAYTPNGYIDYTDEQIHKDYKIYHISGDVGTGKSTLLNKIVIEGKKRGLFVEVLHTPLIPEKIMTVIIKDLKIAFTTSDLLKEKAYQLINTDHYLDREYLKVYEEDIKEDKKVFNELIDIGINNIKNAKKNHDIIEAFYIPNMNFDGYDQLRDDIVNRMIEYK